MKRIVLVLVVFLVAASSATFSQQGSKPEGKAANAVLVPQEEQATKEDIAALLDVMHSRRTIDAMFQMMREQMLKSMHESFLQQHPTASPEVLKKLDATMDGVFKYLKTDDVIAISIPIYQKYISHEDAIALTSFYSSPTGQRFLDRMPALVKEAGDAGADMMRAHTQEIQHQAEKKYDEFLQYIAAHPEEIGASPRPQPEQ
jgi:hypothetical protein